MTSARLQVGMPLSYSGGFDRTAEDLRDFERAGLDVVFLAEAYTFDSVSQLGYLAARTSTVKLAASILNIYTRSPSLLAMTAAGLDAVSGGRFELGIGASGPQVIEGFHGIRYDAPLARTREVVAICRQVWQREPVVHDGAHYQVPLRSERGGSGLGKPLKLINTPVRPRIPVFLAALGPKNVALAAELFDGWSPIFYFPERAEDAFGEALRDGGSGRDPSLAPLHVIADTHVAITEDADEERAARDRVRRHLALYVGGMGAPGRNFYNTLIGRFGFEDTARTVQELYLSGRRDEAAAVIPDELVGGVSLIGPPSYVAERVYAFASTGVGTINAVPLAATHDRRVRDIEQLKKFCA
jgi:F420-dependent oxidoreductase-like protein